MSYAADPSPSYAHYTSRRATPSSHTHTTMDCELDRRIHAASSPSPSPTFGMPYDDMTESSSIAGSSVTTQSDPWSQFNAAQCQPPYDNFHVGHCLPSTDPRTHVPITKLRTSASRAQSPATSPSPFPVISCGQCGVEFTGQYRRGNLRRHVKYAHNGAKAFQCPVEGCDKDFRRNDAWLKHARKHHPELYLTPALAKQGMASTSPVLGLEQSLPSSTDAATTNEAVAGRHEGPFQQDAEFATEVEALLHTARVVCTTLRHELGARNYSWYMEGRFARWEAVVEQLRRQSSDAYFVYCRVLVDVQAIVAAIETDFDPSAPEQYHSRPAHSEGAGSCGGSLTSPNIDASTNPSRQDGKGKGRAQSQATGHDNRVQVSIAGNPLKQKRDHIGCPFFQRAKMFRPNENPPGKCKNCCVKDMAGCRAHFKPRRAGVPGVHKNDLTYYMHCGTCRVDFVDSQKYEEHHGTCVKYSMPRDDVERQWIPLCLTLFPDDVDVPSPYPGVNTPLDRAFVALYRPRAMIPAGSSSDQQSSMSSSHEMPTPSPLLDFNNGLYLAAAYLVIGDVAGNSSVPPTGVANHVFGPMPSARDHLQAIIGNERGVIESLFACERQLSSGEPTADQIQGLVDRAQATVAAALALQQHQQALASQQFLVGENHVHLQSPTQYTRLDSDTSGYYQPMSPTRSYERHDSGDHDTQLHMSAPSTDPAYLSPTAYQAPSPFNNQLDQGLHDYDQQSYATFTPASYQPSPTVSSLPYNSFSMSAQSSSLGFDANSSYHLSTTTGPTSATAFSDVAPDVTLNCWPPLHSGWPLPGQPDPSFLTQPTPDFDRNVDDDQSLYLQYMGGGS